MNWIAYKSFDEIPKWEGNKPFAYLDQNVLDVLVEPNNEARIDYLRSQFQVVYSEHTLSEIYRAGKNGNDSDATKFLHLLRNLKAMHIRPLTDGNYIEREELAIRDSDPFELMEEYGNRGFEDATEMMKSFMEKLYGGLKDRTLNEIGDGSVELFEQLTQEIERHIDDIAPFLPAEAKQLLSENDAQLNAYKKSVAKGKDVYGATGEIRDWAPVTDFREAIR